MIKLKFLCVIAFFILAVTSQSHAVISVTSPPPPSSSSSGNATSLNGTDITSMTGIAGFNAGAYTDIDTAAELETYATLGDYFSTIAASGVTDESSFKIATNLHLYDSEDEIEATIFDSDAETVTGAWSVSDNVFLSFGSGTTKYRFKYNSTSENLEIHYVDVKSGTTTIVWIEPDGSLSTASLSSPSSKLYDLDAAGADRTDELIGGIEGDMTDTTEDAEYSYTQQTYMHNGTEYAGVKSESISATDGHWAGRALVFTVDSGTTNSSFGQAYISDPVNNDGELTNGDADYAATGVSMVPCIGLALATGTGAKNILLYGWITETDWNWTTGGFIYLSDDPSTTEGLTQTAPSTSGDQVQVLGIALSADTIYFNPSMCIIEVP